ncbi:response regulator [Patescibacteria group bacterium]|nr:response regulator [Patescibacteria group bacterium]MBU4098414.1 response regulator [Patescibacteria group bacterium]
MNGEKIILVEDDPFLHKLYKDVLTIAGYNVVSAKDGEEGLNTIKNNVDASLILLDLMMPKLNGIDVLKELKKDPATKDLSVIVLTNLKEGAIIQEALKLGANAYLLKADYTPAQITDTVRQYIDLRYHLKKQE